MRAQVLLEVKEGDLHIIRRGEEIAKLVIENKSATVFGVLKTLFGDVLVNSLGHFAARDELVFPETKESAELRSNLLLTVEAIVFSPLLRLFSVRVILFGLDLANKLGKRLKIVA